MKDAKGTFIKRQKKAVLPLLHFLQNKTITEICAGDGQLSNILSKHGFKIGREYDIEPQDERIIKKSFQELSNHDIDDVIVTNPPWNRKILHPIIEKFVIEMKIPCWLLFDSDWFHTKQAIRFKPYIHKKVSVGRFKWIENSKSTGKDNCAWYYFNGDNNKYAELY